MRKKISLFLCITTLIYTLTACSATPVAAKPVLTNQVNMPAGNVFSPAVIQIKVGETVTWTNTDHIAHNVHLEGNINWVSPSVDPGASTSYTFKSPGTIPYVCDYHAPHMEGKIIVVGP